MAVRKISCGVVVTWRIIRATTWVTSQQIRVKRRAELPRLASGSSGRVAMWERFQDKDNERKHVGRKYGSETSSQPMADFQLNLGVGGFQEEISTLPYQSRNEVDFQHHLPYT